ncbi:MAG: hypothetical protein AB8G05_16355 [Oligoflexales bacterium]
MAFNGDSFRILLIYFLALSLISCEDELLQTDELNLVKSNNSIIEEDGEKTQLRFDPSQKETQSIKGSTQSSIKEASVVIPPGSLSVETVVTMEEGAPIGTETFFTELAVDDGVAIVDSAPAVVVSSSELVDPAGTLQISVPIITQTQLSADDFLLWAILYKVKVAASDEFLVGYLPRSDFTIDQNSGTASFETKYFGSFQAVKLNIAVTEKAEAKSSSPIKTKTEHLENPEIEKNIRDEENIDTKDPNESNQENDGEQIDEITANQTSLPSPSEVAFSQPSPHASSLANVSFTFTESTDSSYLYNVKACSDDACSSSCVSLSQHTNSPASLTGLVDGTAYFACVQTEDSEGNLSGFVSSSASILVDLTSPSAPTNVSLAEGAYISTNSLSVSFTASTDPHFDTHLVKFCSDSGCSSNCTTAVESVSGPITISNLNDGGYYACIQGVDSLGHVSPLVASDASSIIDTSTPAAPSSVSISDSSPHNSASIVISFNSGSDTNFKTHNIKACTDNSCSSACVGSSTTASTPANIAGLQDGITYYACVQSEDHAGNLSAFAASSGAVTIDLTDPSISDVSATNGNKKVSDTVSINVTFTEAVTVGGTPRLLLETGATDRYATYSSGSGSTILVFSNTVQSGDTNDDLDYVSTSSLDLNGGSIADAAANNASLTLASPGTSGSLAFSSSVKVDTTNPTSVSVSNPASTTYNQEVSASWSGGTDDNFSTFNVKACTSNDCSTACVGDATASTSPKTIIGLVIGSSYYMCVESVDDSGNSSTWSASASSIASQEPIYGSGSDGDKTITTSITNEDTSLLGRTLAASRAVIGKGTWSGSTLELTLGSTFTSTDFTVGDEVIWTVVATGTSPTDCSTSDRGTYGFADVTAIDTGNDKLSIDENLSFTPNDDSVTGTTFCHVILSRVPEFDNLTINSGISLSVAAFPYASTSSGGGVLAIKVSDTLTAVGTANISVSETGFAGGHSSGSIMYVGRNIQSGSSTGDDNVGNGGGGAYWNSTGGGGGGGHGAGGNGYTKTNGGTSIPSIQSCGGDCDPETYLFFGGGGGNGKSQTGGKGGGIIIIYASTITGGSATLNVTANGQTGPTVSSGTDAAGGGAGGTVFVNSDSISGLGTLNIEANGGDSSLQATAGGGGGWGWDDLC